MRYAHIRDLAMIRRDLIPVLDIEREVYGLNAWSATDFEAAMQADCTGIVAESDADEDVVGYLVYESTVTTINVLNITVAVGWQRLGIGAALLRAVRSRSGGREVMLHLRESNLDAQLFLRSQGFVALAVVREYYEDTDEDAYVFRYGAVRAEHEGEQPVKRRRRNT